MIAEVSYPNVKTDYLTMTNVCVNTWSLLGLLNERCQNCINQQFSK